MPIYKAVFLFYNEYNMCVTTIYVHLSKYRSLDFNYIFSSIYHPIEVEL